MKKKPLHEILKRTDNLNEEIKCLLKQAGYEYGNQSLDLEYDPQNADQLLLADELAKIMWLLEIASCQIDCLKEKTHPET